MKLTQDPREIFKKGSYDEGKRICLRLYFSRPINKHKRPQHQKRAMSYRIFLMSLKGRPYHRIGKIFKISTERIRQIICYEIRDMRLFSCTDKFKNYFTMEISRGDP